MLPRLEVHGVMAAKIDCNASAMKKICKASAGDKAEAMSALTKYDSLTDERAQEVQTSYTV